MHAPFAYSTSAAWYNSHFVKMCCSVSFSCDLQIHQSYYIIVGFKTFERRLLTEPDKRAHHFDSFVTVVLQRRKHRQTFNFKRSNEMQWWRLPVLHWPVFVVSRCRRWFASLLRQDVRAGAVGCIVCLAYKDWWDGWLTDDDKESNDGKGDRTDDIQEWYLLNAYPPLR